tara:strand:+ start:394 stop:1050 length:657 start_codon:yes stop_codon:yes gene_type:complete
VIDIPKAPKVPIFLGVARWAEVLLMVNPVGDVPLKSDVSGTEDGVAWDKRNPIIIFPMLDPPAGLGARDHPMLAFDPVSGKKGWVCVSLFRDRTLLNVSPLSEDPTDKSLIREITDIFAVSNWDAILGMIDVDNISHMIPNNMKERMERGERSVFDPLSSVWWAGESCDACGAPTLDRDDDDPCPACGEPKVFKKQPVVDMSEEMSDDGSFGLGDEWI